VALEHVGRLDHVVVDADEDHVVELHVGSSWSARGILARVAPPAPPC
jgi:hypothetical protein